MTLFADSFYFFALLNSSDNAHALAADFTKKFVGNLVTTAWVITELADGMSTLAQREAFIRFLDGLRQQPNMKLAPPDLALFDEGITLYRKRLDKEWSLTDCISFVVMQQEGITEALTGDHHFEQAGFRAILKK
jgi:predicted nucleic acid-binding protein